MAEQFSLREYISIELPAKYPYRTTDELGLLAEVATARSYGLQDLTCKRPCVEAAVAIEEDNLKGIDVLAGFIIERKRRGMI